MKENGVMVSVIVLTYNHEKYISQALDSILMQKTDFLYEILVGDDASTDKTGEILRLYAKDNPDKIRLYRNSENEGAAKNAYGLLLRAKGKYLAFCEGDDYWIHEEKLARQIDFLEKNTQYIGCSHKCVVVDGNGEKKKDQKLDWVRYKDPFTLDDFKGIYLPGQTATIVKRNIFLGKKDPYPFLYEINKNISDRTSTLLYLSKGSFSFLPEVMSAYRQTGKSGITNLVYNLNPNRILHELEYTDHLNTLASKLSLKLGIFDEYYMQLYAWAVWQYLKAPSCGKKRVVAETAARLGKGLVHPYAFIHGMLQKKGII